ncbi:hypothetical protein AGMMS49949_09170 [Alphaproteobacteria bacterium]|nr:hypothetical protein AGMMS49949_09170 [Alphaproteobacteria bacterium]
MQKLVNAIKKCPGWIVPMNPNRRVRGPGVMGLMRPVGLCANQALNKRMGPL